MNKILTTVGLAALGAASLQAQYAPGLTALEMSKAWSLSVDLRGFYDDNYLTQPKSFPTGVPGVNGHPISTWGTEISPSAAFNHSVESTLMSASYIYDERWNENHSINDQSHQFNGRLEHEFSERYKLSVNESFVMAQEPTVIDPSIITTPLRLEGNNVRNTGQVDFTAVLTKDFDLHLGYGNTIYHYQQDSELLTMTAPPLSAETNGPTRSGLLDRMEQLATVDLRWKATPETTGILGYQYGHVDYTSPEYIIFPGTAPVTPGYRSDIRNEDSHYVFVGADESFTPNLNGSIRAGGQYLDYYKYGTSRLSPYVDASLTDQYMPGCSGQLGVKHVHNSTDVAGFIGTTPVLDEESTAVYISDSHKLTERLTATVMGQAQLSTFDGGGSGYNGKSEDFYVLQVNFSYHFNPWFLTEAGYNFSKLLSDLPGRAYTRDFMYVGLRATY